MLNQPKYQKLFSTPIMRFQVEGSESINDELLDQCEMMKAKSIGSSKSNKGGWHSKGNLFAVQNAAIQSVETAAQDAVFEITRKVSTKVKPEELKLKLFAWMNSNPSGGYNAPHTHPGAHWSGVYYVSQPDVEKGSSGMIEFLDPRSDLPHWRILKASSFAAKKTIRPIAGELIIFPSYLVHWVHPNESNQDRVSIAFNGTFSRR